MRKKIISFMTVLVLLLSMFMTAYAEEDARRIPLRNQGSTAAELKSYGTIVYQRGSDTIKIDSDDLYNLADQIDKVKIEVTDQLKAMNTYFTAGEGISLTTSTDINVAHAEPYEEDFVDPLDVNFDTLLEGIAVSQSVSSDVTAYGYLPGTKLYKREDGLLTTNGSEQGAEEISITAASAENLSAGTAAWVDGSLILGTGGDNKDYQEKIAGDFIMTHTRSNPDPQKYMCYFAGAYHHTGGGGYYLVVPKSYGNDLSFFSGISGYIRIPAGVASSQLPVSDYNLYIWGPLNTRDFW